MKKILEGENGQLQKSWKSKKEKGLLRNLHYEVRVCMVYGVWCVVCGVGGDDDRNLLDNIGICC